MNKINSTSTISLLSNTKTKKNFLNNLTKNLINNEKKFCANNYDPIKNLTFIKGSNIYLWDKNDNKYYDFIAGYSAVNQGHCHPRLINTLNEQSSQLTLTSRAVYTEELSKYSEFITKIFNYDKVLPTNTGVEAGETAIKMARAWGYKNKFIQQNKAVILFAKNNFWGRSIAACSSSSSPLCYNNYGPYTPGFELIEYNNISALKEKLENNKNIVAYMLEPIQGEGGIIIPSENYLHEVKKLCEKYNILLIADEVQTGLGRTGELYNFKKYDIKPDILCLGKALSGGIMPISAVLSNSEIMNCIATGSHGSTFGGNPLSCKIATTAINIIKDEELCKNSQNVGKFFRNELQNLNFDLIKDIRGQGLLNAIEFNTEELTNKAIQNLLNNGILTKNTNRTTIRFTPPLTISKSLMEHALEKIYYSINKL